MLTHHVDQNNKHAFRKNEYSQLGFRLTFLLDTLWIMQVYPANLPTLFYPEVFLSF